MPCREHSRRYWRCRGRCLLHRKAKGYSQSDMARLLEDRGLPFQQQTILKIEKGSRPLKLEEAYMIADVLDIELSLLTEQFTNDAIAAAATKILQRAAAIARHDKSVEIRWYARYYDPSGKRAL
jgi:transcriptional regulator with XRE-family HTH domain